MEHGASINDASVLDKFDVRISFVRISRIVGADFA
jgi:hypothetical protein